VGPLVLNNKIEQAKEVLDTGRSAVSKSIKMIIDKSAALSKIYTDTRTVVKHGQ